MSDIKRYDPGCAYVGEEEMIIMHDGDYVTHSDHIAALEQSQKSNEFLKEQLSKLAKFNPDWDMLQACQTSWKEVSAELHSARKRIAELEASQLPVKLPPHKFSECVNELLEEAIAYAGTQQLRARLASRLSNFVKPGHEAGITVQGDD